MLLFLELVYLYVIEKISIKMYAMFLWLMPLLAEIKNGKLRQ